MPKFAKGQVVTDALLLEPTTKPRKGCRDEPAWVCRLPGGELRIISERDLRRRKGGGTVGILQAKANQILAGYRFRCKKKNIFWELTPEQFFKLAQENCEYCGCEPSNRGHLPFIYNGVDRKDNAKGYTLSNSVACCARCNAIKSSLLSHEEMKVAMKAILKLTRGKAKTRPHHKKPKPK